MVVDASKHAQAEVDVHVRMWFGDDGDMVRNPYQMLMLISLTRLRRLLATWSNSPPRPAPP